MVRCFVRLIISSHIIHIVHTTLTRVNCSRHRSTKHLFQPLLYNLHIVILSIHIVKLKVPVMSDVVLHTNTVWASGSRDGRCGGWSKGIHVVCPSFGPSVWMLKLLSTIVNQISCMKVIKRRARPNQSSILKHSRSIKASLARRGKPSMPKKALDQPTPSIIDIVLWFIPSTQKLLDRA